MLTAPVNIAVFATFHFAREAWIGTRREFMRAGGGRQLDICRYGWQRWQDRGKKWQRNGKVNGKNGKVW
jgi:hypothetical protein